MHNFNSFKKLKFSYVLVIPSNNWKKIITNDNKSSWKENAYPFFVKIFNGYRRVPK